MEGLEDIQTRPKYHASIRFLGRVQGCDAICPWRKYLRDAQTALPSNEMTRFSDV